jgi:hypothetical protein
MPRYVKTADQVQAVQATQPAGEDVVGTAQGGFPLGLPREDYPKKLTRQELNMLEQLYVSNAFRVDKDDTTDLSCLIEPGRCDYRGAVITYAGAVNQALTANAINYVFLKFDTGSAVLEINITGFPADASIAPHIRLAIITTGASSYEYTDIDHSCRQSAAWTVVGAVTSGEHVGNNSFEGTVTYVPSDVQSLLAADDITVTHRIMLVVGNGGAVSLTSTPSIADAVDGMIVTIEGTDDTNTVTLQDYRNLAGTGLLMDSQVDVTLGNNDSIEFRYKASDEKWVERGRALV